MHNEAERFWMYILEKKKRIITKREIKELYNKFIRQWNEKNNFEKTFRNIQISKIKYMLNKKWLVLTEDQLIALKYRKIQDYFLLLNFLDEENVNWYFGIATAKYFNKLTWQNQKTIYILNTKYQIKRKIGGDFVELIKIPQELFLKKSLHYFKKGNYNIPYSDKEKTILDEIYFREYKKFKIQIMDYENLDIENLNHDLLAYQKYPLVKSFLIETLSKKELKRLR